MVVPLGGRQLCSESQGRMGTRPEEGLFGECGYMPLNFVTGLHFLSLFYRA